MKIVCFAMLLISGSFLMAQDSNSANPSPQDSKGSKGQVTVRGCVSRSSGSFILMKQDPAVTYELQGAHKIKLSHYLGQHVEVIGNESPTMSTSSDADRRSASPVTLTITSIKTIDKECPAEKISAQ
jgi:hypothetical protein